MFGYLTDPICKPSRDASEVHWGHPLASGLIGLWLFNDLGSSVKNYAAPGDGGMLVTGTWRADGLRCDNANGAYYTTCPNALKPTAAVTFVWRGITDANPSGPSNPIIGGSTYSFGNSAPYSNWDLSRRQENYSQTYFCINAAGTQYVHTLTTPQDRVTALGITYRSGDFSAWIDGVLAATNATPTSAISYSGDPALNFGTNFTRDPDEVTQAAWAYDRALSADLMHWLWKEPYCMLRPVRQIRYFFLEDVPIDHVEVLPPPGFAINNASPLALHPLNVNLSMWLLGIPGTTGGSMIFDLARRYDGTLTGGPAWKEYSPRISAVNCDGSDDYIETAFTGVRIDQACSIGFQIKSGETTTHACVFGRNTFGNTNGFQIECDGAGKIQVNRDSAFSSFFASTANVFDDAWHDVVLTSDGTNLTWYVDGFVSGTSTLSSYVDNSDAARIMAQRGTSGREVIGQVSGVWVAARCLTAADVFECYRQWRMGFPDLLNNSLPSSGYGNFHPDLEQVSYRWRYDNGSESSAGWIAAASTAITRARELATRVRVLTNNQQATAVNQRVKLQYRRKRSPSGQWHNIGE